MHESASDPTTPRVPWRAGLLSLGLHAVLVASVALVRMPQAPPGERSAIVMQLVDVPATPSRPDVDEASPAAVPPTPTEAESIASNSPDEPGASDSGQADADRDEPAQHSGIAARLLDQVAESAGAPPARKDETPAWPTTGERVLGVPGTRGWLSAHIGGVAPTTHQWRASDGAMRARHVLASGRAICTQRRAPTIDELMNPWKSLAVTLVSACGRERPPPPDFSDPRVQPPPVRLGRGQP
jgi:hypothetical protein